jgi:hypothetical protein
MLEISRTLPEVFILKYEDFVDGRLEELSRYLNLPLALNVEVASDVKRVVRTKSYGYWKDWYTSDDINFFRSAFAPLLRSFSYDDDWEPNASPTIDRATGSDYMTRIVTELREAKVDSQLGNSNIPRGAIQRVKQSLLKIWRLLPGS